MPAPPLATAPDPSLADDVSVLPGVGERRAEPMRRAGADTVGALFRYYPRRYLDRSTVTPIHELTDEAGAVTVVGEVVATGLAGQGRKMRLELRIQDESGGVMKAVWFRGAHYLHRLFRKGDKLALHGQVQQYGKTFSMAHPETDKLESNAPALTTGRIIPLYPGTAALDKVGMNSRALRRVIYGAFKSHGLLIPEILPEEIRERYGLIAGNVALRAAHFPKDSAELGRAMRRLKFEELFFLQLVLAFLHGRRKRQPGPQFYQPDDGEETYLQRFLDGLPFTFTNAQKKALRDIAKDTEAGQQMNRLVQGDVGSGKTVVAVAAMMMALDAGYQSAFMAPTEILTEQHYANLKSYLEPLGVEVRLLIGGQRKALRDEILADLAEGRAHVAVGTHAVIQDTVRFQKLGLAVVDEQHRFGVEQRAQMFEKGERPHMLLMTATPIPRSLAMTVYGDLDVTVMDERPAGRKPIITRVYGEKKRDDAYAFIKEQLREGRQAYVVYPLVEESEAETLADVKDAENGAAELAERFRPYSVDLVHGRMLAYEKEEAMARFKAGETDILVATTVIEVGVDVPNASIMVIEHAERFGLSQLHQLRGRVGRGEYQSHCILMAGPKRTHEAEARLTAMAATDDGFIISEEDLKLRGAGDLFGTRQSGEAALKLADLVRDQEILQEAREAAFALAEADPQLQHPDHQHIRERLRKSAPKELRFVQVG
jgi:ATP-dependent DNA helicase RecG